MKQYRRAGAGPTTASLARVGGPSPGKNSRSQRRYAGVPAQRSQPVGGGAAAIQRKAEPGAEGVAAEAHDHDHGPHVDAAQPQVEGESSSTGPLSESRSQEVLQEAFGDYKTISEGSVRVLGQAEFQEAYDAIYGETQWAWDTWVAPTHGNLNGFAHDNTNYINRTTANQGTVPHEMLHNNAASDWRPFVGSQFDEGATDVLKQHALQAAGLSSPNSYPNQIRCVETFLDSGVSRDSLFRAYLCGGAATIVGTHVDSNCAANWSQVKEAMQAQNWALARTRLARSASDSAAEEGGDSAGASQ